MVLPLATCGHPSSSSHTVSIFPLSLVLLWVRVLHGCVLVVVGNVFFVHPLLQGQGHSCEQCETQLQPLYCQATTNRVSVGLWWAVEAWQWRFACVWLKECSSSAPLQCCWSYCAVELPSDDGGLEDGLLPRCWQHSGAEAGWRHTSHCPQTGRTSCTGWVP